MKIALFCDRDKRVFNDIVFNSLSKNEYGYLKDELEKHGMQLHTYDIYAINKIVPDVCLFLDYPERPKHIDNILAQKKILISREPFLIVPENYKIDLHKNFDIVLTWSRDLIDGQKYLKYPSTRIIDTNIDFDPYFSRSNMFTLINSNLKSRLPGEIYSERVKIFEWFEKNPIYNFSLYGKNWDRHILNLFGKNLALPFPKRYIKSYKGVCANKRDVLLGSTFNFAFENCRINDLVTEKIFDSFQAGAIPIYFGAPNINSLIPADLYISYDNYNSIDDVVKYCTELSEADLINIRQNIHEYMSSESNNSYKISYWIECIINAINQR